MGFGWITTASIPIKSSVVKAATKGQFRVIYNLQQFPLCQVGKQDELPLSKDSQ
jgi:hypothetical protein